jgi:cardiolipin synthase A/B
VAQLEALFLTDHYVETETELEDALHLSVPAPVGQVTAHLFPSGPAYPRANHQDLLISLIHAARQEIIIVTPYFVPDELFTHALRSARDRGVEVSLILPRKADSRLTNFAQESHYEELLECGVRLHLYRNGFLHAKHITIDHALAVIGSTNIDIRSFALNAEASLLIYHQATVAALESHNDRYTAQSDLIELDQWKQRPLWKQTLENLARLADSLL